MGDAAREVGGIACGSDDIQAHIRPWLAINSAGTVVTDRLRSNRVWVFWEEFHGGFQVERIIVFVGGGG